MRKTGLECPESSAKTGIPPSDVLVGAPLADRAGVGSAGFGAIPDRTGALILRRRASKSALRTELEHRSVNWPPAIKSARGLSGWNGRPLMNWSAWILALLEQFDDGLVVVAIGTRADQLDLAHDPTERVDLRFVHPDGAIHNGTATSGTAVTTDRWAVRQG
jgi:hypothetical protein